MTVSIHRLLDRYEERLARRGPRLCGFLEGGDPNYLIVQNPPGGVWTRCNSVEQVYQSNIEYVRDALEVEWTDDLPFFEPWVGTGVYAAAFGCPYVFREGEAPHVRYRYQRVEQLRGLEYPDWRRCEIMTMVLNCIDCFLERTEGRIPIALTDTQSPFDTASLVLDACELFAACYTHEDLVLELAGKVAELVVEFSRAQIERIGPARLAQPGHQMPSLAGGVGLALSDDNLSVCSPRVNERIALAMDQRLADALGGLAIHSCGRWTHTMPLLQRMRGVLAVECAVGTGSDDPCPNPPAEVRRALAGSSIYVKARLGDDVDKALAALDELADPSLRLVVQIGYDPENAERNYRLIEERLEKVYAV